MHTQYHHISHIVILQVFIEKAAVYFHSFFPISTVTGILFNDHDKNILLRYQASQNHRSIIQPKFVTKTSSISLDILSHSN